MSNSKTLVEIWETYSKQVLNEKAPGKKADKMAKKPGPGAVNLNDKKATEMQNKDTTGPAAAEGVNHDIIDAKKKGQKENAYNINNLSFSENFDKSIEKTSKDEINNYMKSVFDKLFEEVMSGDDAADMQALGIDAGGDAGAEGAGGDVTVTLTSDQVEALKAILAQIEGEGGDTEAEGAEGDMGGEDMGGEEDAEEKHEKEEDAEEKEEDAEEKHEKEEDAEEKDDAMKEATEMKEVPDSAGKSLQNKNNKVGDKTAKLAKSGKADGKVTATVDGDGKDVPDSAGLGLTKHGANKPHSKIKGGNQEFFGV